MGWLITLGVLLGLAVLPLGVSLRYDEEGTLVKVLAGPMKILVFPRPKKVKKEKPAKDKKATREPPKEDPVPPMPEPPKQTAPREATKKGGSLTDFLPLVKLALDFLGDFRRKLRLNRLDVKLILGGGDPSDLAVSYGRTWAAVGNLLPQLERLFVIEKRDIQVECDFSASQTTILAHVDVTITLGRLLSMATVYGIRAVKEYFAIQKKRKGGAAI